MEVTVNFRGASVKVFGAPFFKKARPCPCPYRRAAHEKKLGKQRSVFPGRWGTKKVVSQGLGGVASSLPSQSRLTPCQLPRRGSRVSSPPEACKRPSLASPFGGGGLALARTERAAHQRLAEDQVLPPPLGEVPPQGAERAAHQRLAEDQVLPPPLGGAGAQWAPFSAWSPLPRRSVMDAAHWAASPEPAGESAPAGGGGGSPPAAPPQNNPCLP